MRSLGILVVLFFLITFAGMYYLGMDRGMKKERRRQNRITDYITRMETHIELCPPIQRAQLEQEYFRQLADMLKETNRKEIR